MTPYKIETCDWTVGCRHGMSRPWRRPPWPSQLLNPLVKENQYLLIRSNHPTSALPNAGCSLTFILVYAKVSHPRLVGDESHNRRLVYSSSGFESRNRRNKASIWSKVRLDCPVLFKIPRWLGGNGIWYARRNFSSLWGETVSEGNHIDFR